MTKPGPRPPELRGFWRNRPTGRGENGRGWNRTLPTARDGFLHLPQNAARREDSFLAHTGDQDMNWDRIEGQWKQLKGQAQQRWGKLTDDDWDLIQGKREELVGKVQSLYGKKKDDAEREVDAWGNELR